MVSNKELLRGIPFFAGLETDSLTLERLAATTYEEKYEAGQILFLEGEPCRGLYYVVKGRVRIFKAEPGGREQVLRLAGAGTSFNEVPVFDGGQNPASVDAVDDCTIWIVPAETVRTLLETEPAVARAVAKVFSARLRHLTTLIAEVSLKQVSARVAKLLLNRLGEEPILGVGISEQVTSQFTQQQMAAMAGTVREMVGRALRTMQKAGAIEAKRGYILIKDQEKLQTFL
ncbi:MAG: Crp/Fnr family transcriptional regulator [Chloroflexi bacterium]|uniref:Crp/Fnr family transcriptional regulator n=1 Tax=Candidatus Chlorohelix allophototropha TaxID=3003348 RepID=A0A8T7M1A0_9CHLR|nr:Crp/Fnr family transcriptional regulator [Chloroflexota bacterium]WJW66327.1 Crp/Fnr family transcriptional regulator [Chloroflexota bacterium L227-S17]